MVIAHEAPSPPGAFVYPLVYELRAGYYDVDPLVAFPVEVDLAIRYADDEATSLDESRFVIGRLDMTTATSLDFRHFRHPGRTPSSVDHQR